MNYLVITSNGIGGSEVRLIKCWLLIKQNSLVKGLKLVVDKKLLDLLHTREEFHRLSLYKEDIITQEFSLSFRESNAQLSNFLNQTLEAGDCAHVLLQYPMSFKKKNVKIIYTHPATTIFGFTNLNGILGQFYFVFKAQLIDVLDPFVFSFFRTVFFYKRKNIRLTQYGVDESLFKLAKSIDYSAKNKDLVFLGRFVPGKQILELMNALSTIHALLSEKNIKDYNFVIIGQGPLLREVEEVYTKLVAEKVPLQLHRAVSNPYPFLLRARGFFSLQKVNNYPSQSLFEGILAGCLPIVTDCGDTRRIAKPDFSFFVPEKFSSKEIAQQVYTLLNLEQDIVKEKSQQAITYIEREFYSMKMAEYYASLYN